MSVTICGIAFEQHHYDARGDVLYVSVADYEGPPARAFSTPEGHNVEYDESGRAIGMTLVNVQALLERDGELRLTWPTDHLTSAQLEHALTPAA